MAKRVSGVRKIWHEDSPVASDPTTTPANWTDAGKILNGFEPGLETGSVEDGAGAPIQTDATALRVYELIDMDSFTNLRTAELAGTRQDIAEELLNGDYRIYRNCKVNVDYMPNPGKGAIQTLRLQASTAADKYATIRDIVVPP